MARTKTKKPEPPASPRAAGRKYSTEGRAGKPSMEPPASPGAAGRKRSKKQAGDPYRKATVLIPLTFNDDTQIPIDVLLNIKDQLTVNFIGHTDEGTVDGEYLMSSGLKLRQIDEALRVP